VKVRHKRRNFWRVLPRWVAPVASGVVLGANRAMSSSTPLIKRAILDESAHVATTALALEASRPHDRRFLASAFLAAVMIDVDHVPDAIFGWDALNAGSPRPYTHSLVTIAAVMALGALASPPRRHWFDGLAFGLATHFLRDATDGTGGLPLLWPVSRNGFRLPAWLQAPLVLGALCWTRARRTAR